MIVEMTMKRWLVLLALTALLMAGAAAARPVFSLNTIEPAAQVEEKQGVDGRAPQSGFIEIVAE